MKEQNMFYSFICHVPTNNTTTHNTSIHAQHR